MVAHGSTEETMCLVSALIALLLVAYGLNADTPNKSKKCIRCGSWAPADQEHCRG